MVERPVRSLVAYAGTEGGTTLAASATPALCAAMTSLSKDPVFSGVNLDSMSAAHLLTEVAFSGSGIERAAMARHLTPASAYAFPDIHRMAMANSKSMAAALGFLEKSMLSLAAHYGCQFTGDAKAIAYSVLHDFGGLSLADFLIFFEKAKAGKYKQDFQHIATRGINWDFLKTWLDCYLEEREAARLELRAQYDRPAPNAIEADRAKTEAAIKAARQAAFNEAERRRVLEQRAQVFRDKWEMEVYQSVMVHQWYKDTLVRVWNGFSDLTSPPKDPEYIKTETLCTDDDPARKRCESYPMRVFRPDGLKRLMTRIIYESVEFRDSQNTIETAAAFAAQNAEHYDAAAKMAVAQIKSLFNKWPALEILKTHIRAKHPDAPEKRVTRTAHEAMTQMERWYYDEYLPVCIEQERPAMYKQEFQANTALENFVKDGNENPITKILFPK